MTILSVRACAALARRKADAHPEGVAHATLLSWLQQVGADRQRAERGIRLAIDRNWIETSADDQAIVRTAVELEQAA